MLTSELFNLAYGRYCQLAELASLTSNNKINSGIYALFFFSNPTNKVIPLYIGQSKNIPNRMRSHKAAINKLFRMTEIEFNNHINSGKQDGNHLYTKIVIYLKNNNLSPHDLKFKILATDINNKYLRLKKEAELIEYYQTDIFGFNQLEFIQLANYHSNSKIAYSTTNITKMWKSGIKFIDKFDNDWLAYGYNQFNLASFIEWAKIHISVNKNINIIKSSELKPATNNSQIIFFEFQTKFKQFINYLENISELNKY